MPQVVAKVSSASASVSKLLSIAAPPKTPAPQAFIFMKQLEKTQGEEARHLRPSAAPNKPAAKAGSKAAAKPASTNKKVSKPVPTKSEKPEAARQSQRENRKTETLGTILKTIQIPIRRIQTNLLRTLRRKAMGITLQPIQTPRMTLPQPWPHRNWPLPVRRPMPPGIRAVRRRITRPIRKTVMETPRVRTHNPTPWPTSSPRVSRDRAGCNYIAIGKPKRPTV